MLLLSCSYGDRPLTTYDWRQIFFSFLLSVKEYHWSLEIISCPCYRHAGACNQLSTELAKVRQEIRGQSCLFTCNVLEWKWKIIFITLAKHTVGRPGTKMIILFLRYFKNIICKHHLKGVLQPLFLWLFHFHFHERGHLWVGNMGTHCLLWYSNLHWQPTKTKKYHHRPILWMFDVHLNLWQRILLL